jgi:hypothetical protein
VPLTKDQREHAQARAEEQMKHRRARDKRSRLENIMALANDTRAPAGEHAAAMAAIARVKGD